MIPVIHDGKTTVLIQKECFIAAVTNLKDARSLFLQVPASVMNGLYCLDTTNNIYKFVSNYNEAFEFYSKPQFSIQQVEEEILRVSIIPKDKFGK